VRHPLLDHHQLTSSPRCRRRWLRRPPHEWRLVRRQAVAVACLDYSGGGLTTKNIYRYDLRYECERCDARATFSTTDHDVLWALGVEVPERAEAHQ
jgi:hypothetical protein